MGSAPHAGPELRGTWAPGALADLFGQELTHAYEIVLLAGHWLAVPKTAPFVTISGLTAAELQERLAADYEMRALHRRANPCWRLRCSTVTLPLELGPTPVSA